MSQQNYLLAELLLLLLETSATFTQLIPPPCN